MTHTNENTGTMRNTGNEKDFENVEQVSKELLKAMEYDLIHDFRSNYFGAGEHF